MRHPREESRRQLLRWLAASPLLSLAGLPWLQADGPAPGSGSGGEAPAPAGSTPAAPLASPQDAINLFDFQEAARRALPPAHYGYLATGVDGDETLRANREGFERFALRPRRLVDVSRIETRIEVLGETWNTPIMLAPVGSQMAFHEDGELAVARAAAGDAHNQILSTVTTVSVEEVNAARGRPVWYQLYPTSSWEVTRALVRRVRAAGCRVLVLTVDLPVGSNRETLKRMSRLDSRDCASCHGREAGPEDRMGMTSGWLRRKPMFAGLDMRDVDFETPGMTWDFIHRLRDLTDMRILVKGILRGDDTERALEHGVDGVIVSNHGGRADAGGSSTVACLPEVVAAARGRIPVLVDSGFRRGTDVLKALALGADAICIGRPYLWGLASFGQPGVKKVLELLTGELTLAMQLHGVPTLQSLDASFVTRV